MPRDPQPVAEEEQATPDAGHIARGKQPAERHQERDGQTISAGRQMSEKDPAVIPLSGAPAGSFSCRGMLNDASLPGAFAAALSAAGVSGRLIGEFVPSGVGSNGIQPLPGKKTSTQLCASRALTKCCRVLSSRTPALKPLICRLGMPSVRSMTFIAVEKSWQYPFLESKRK